MRAHPGDSMSGNEEFFKKLSGEQHAEKLTVNMGGIEKPTTWLSNAPMIAKQLSELQRCRRGTSQESCGSNHRVSQRPVEDKRLAELDKSWDLM